MPDETGRELHDDHDLLTYSESAARLRSEIAATEALLEDLRRAVAAGDAAAAPKLDEARRRLAQLADSARRNAQQAGRDSHGAGFLNYRGPQAAAGARDAGPQ